MLSKCGHCDGSGRDPCYRNVQKPCPDCHGTGNTKDYVCSRCQGYGRTPSARTEQGVDLDGMMNDLASVRYFLAEKPSMDETERWDCINRIDATVEALRSRLSPGSEATDDPLRYAVESIIAGEVCAYAHGLHERFGGACNPCVAFSEKLAAQLAARRRSVSGGEATDDELQLLLTSPVGTGSDEYNEGWMHAMNLVAKTLAARRSVSATPDAPHDACEHSRDCIACGKRIEPANGLCFSCATTDPKVRMEASRATVPAPGGDVAVSFSSDRSI